ncbi:MAG: hypothetical protein IT448_01840 [Phycisphaerales bacterium]|nr:hypothetical protein [Phycisphaerales bacterium]
MPTRLISILLVLFLGVWLNAILPGHTRGAVTVPSRGGEAAHQKTAADSCCASTSVSTTVSACCQPPPQSTKAGEECQTGRHSKAARCALCFYANLMCPAVGVVVSPPPPAFLKRCAQVSFVEPAASTLFHYDGRAPPLA